VEPHPAADSLSAPSPSVPPEARSSAAPRPARFPLLDYLDALLVAVVLALFVRTFLVQAFVIPSRSMEGNLQVGDRVLVNRFIYAPASSAVERRWLPLRKVERGDVVVFRYPPDPTRDYIKRCVATAGDVVALRQGELVVNGQPVAEPYLAPAARTQPGELGPLDVPLGSVYCLGDNRGNSHDSRAFGAVPESHLRGRALLVYWSVGELPRSNPSPTWAMLATPLRALAATRWERCLRPVR
jgi:signal peptidase I